LYLEHKNQGNDEKLEKENFKIKTRERNK